MDRDDDRRIIEEITLAAQQAGHYIVWTHDADHKPLAQCCECDARGNLENWLPLAEHCPLAPEDSTA